MAHPLALGSLSLTGGGVALVTDEGGSIDPCAVAGLFVDDVRVVSRWHIETSVPCRLAGYERVGPSTDRLMWTVSAPDAVDPIGTLERVRTVSSRGLREEVVITAYARPIVCTVHVTAERDDLPVYDAGEPGAALAGAALARASEPGRYALGAPDVGATVTIDAPGWNAAEVGITVDARATPGDSWRGTLAVEVAGDDRPAGPIDPDSATSIDVVPRELDRLIMTGRTDLKALTMPLDGRSVFGAGSPFFLAMFGRDSLISGMQALIDTPDRLTDILHVLARHQATDVDDATRAEPGRILHELRIGRAGVFGVPPGTPYYGAVDTAALFVVAIGEAMRWGAAKEDVAALLPPARAAMQWCREHGDVDGDGFVESVPHPSGLTNLGWKDSGDSMVRPDGSTLVGPVALSEVQAYWYRAARSVAEIEQWLGEGDGATALAEADRLANDFAAAFVFESDGAPFIGLALDPDKHLLAVRTSNAGHVLWSGILRPELARSVAEQLARPDLFSGWGVRTVGSHEAGYNPFGYHRGSVWPHDTGFALHGAARYGARPTVRLLADGLVALGDALGGQLPELLSGIGRDDVAVPVPYAAACRPQAWSAGASLVVLRSLLGLEPDVAGGVVRLHPSLPPGYELTVRRMRLGDHELSVTVRGDEVVDADSTLAIVTGPDAVLAATDWCPQR